MEFWGVEVKGDKALKVAPFPNEVIHLSHATLADLKKGSNPVMLFAKVGNQKLVIGVLNADTLPQLSFDLVFEKEFELSHNMKNGSVHLTGYKSIMGDEYPCHTDSSSDDEPISLEDTLKEFDARKAATLAAKKDEKCGDESDDDSSEDDSDEDESDESDKELGFAPKPESDSDEEDTDSDEDDTDSSSEEELPLKSAGGKKRPAPDNKTPDAKKAKLVTPQKTAGKKAAAHVDTPHPAKNALNGDKLNVKTPPKSAGQVTCGSCSKSFGSEKGLESHSKVKHNK